MNTKLSALKRQLNLNTRLFKNCLDDVDDSIAVKPTIENVNPFAFVVIHMLGARYFPARMIGLKEVSSLYGLASMKYE